jgi:hypothetical protein
MYTPLQIQTEVRVADILKLMMESGEPVRFYVCHHIAYLICDKLALLPGYDEYYKQHSMGMLYPSEATSIPYFFLVSDADGETKEIPNQYDLSHQVVSQINQWIKKLHGDRFETYDAELSTMFLLHYANNTHGLPSIWWNRIGRINFLKTILEIDPEAVFSVNL